MSWTVAWLVLDEQRILNRRLAILPCLVISQFGDKSKIQPKERVLNKALRLYSNLMDSLIFKVSVMILTVSFLALGIWGSLSIVSRFDPKSMLPRDSYLSKFSHTLEEFYPDFSFRVELMTGSLEVEDLQGMDRMVTQLTQLTQAGPGRILSVVDSWWPDFLTFLDSKNTSWTSLGTTGEFLQLLSDFLYTVEYGIHQNNFKFGGSLTCNKPAPPILATRQNLQLGLSSTLPPPSEYVPAMAQLQEILGKANLSSKAFYDSVLFLSWETDPIILGELWQNLGLAVSAVFLVSFIMLGSFSLSLCVLLCVIFTLIDLVGCLHFWGVTIEAISYINIILATGLAVDYSVHLVYAFSVAEGSNIDRVRHSLVTLGPAILSGGITTILAVILLAFSDSNVLLTFFKVFSLTVIFGVFHGLVFLPTVLSISGSVFSKCDNI